MGFQQPTVGNQPKMNPLLFPKSQLEFDHSLFREPTAEYRGSPLWAWNNKLRRDQLLRQIDYMAEMGLGGFHMHSRTGLATPYMGQEFMDHVKACVQKAEEKNMLACLYDEDRWPSGYGGGLVLEGHPEYKALHLLITPRKYGEGTKTDTQQGANATAVRSEQGALIARYEIKFDESGTNVVEATRLDETDTEETDRNIWYAYAEPNPDSEWFNTGTYIDMFNKKAVGRFIETTHEVYAEALADHFGSTVPSIFTDEPQFAHKTQLKSATDTSDVFLPWTMDLTQTFSQAFGYDILDRLPELVWDIQPSSESINDEKLTRTFTTRYHFHDHVCERFVDAFMDHIADWCKEHGIFLTGHMMKEPTLKSQTDALGEAMRCYRRLDVPGVDMLSDLYEFNTVKQCSSVARQNGARGVMSEIYGVTNWTFDFAGHKASGDWQAALGVTFRVHHLTWVSMAGEGKRDYPACIGYQSNWYKQYPYIENHFARLNVALTRGKPLTRVAVIHPIESFWLRFGPKDSSAEELAYRDEAFEDLTNWLLFGLMDFDFISESLLPSQCSLDSITSDKLPVGQMQYEAIIVPNLRTIRSSTLERLSKFASLGGHVLVVGSSPELIDAKLPLNGPPVIPGAEIVQFTRFHILKSLEKHRDIHVSTKDEGLPTNKLLYQLRDEGQERYLFISNTDRVRCYPTTILIKGNYNIDVMETLTGQEWPLATRSRDGWTEISWHFEAIASVLLRLTELTNGISAPFFTQEQFVARDSLRTLQIPVSLDRVTLSEQNVLLLDYCEWKIGSGSWSEEIEILRAENDVRRELQLPLKLEALRQPWSQPADKIKPKAEVTVRFTFKTEIALEKAKLALEDADNVRIALDGESLTSPVEIEGWWVDEDIHIVSLPHIPMGTHTIDLTYEFGLLSNLERVYLLGDFSVSLRGRHATIISNEEPLDFGDWTTMGLPFYAGDVTYHCSFTAPSDGEDQWLRLEVPRFAGPVLRVEIPSHPDTTLTSQIIAIEPRIVDLGERPAGEKIEVRITCYGNRENSFGTLHKPDGTTRWVASNAWRAEHELWMEEYNVKKMGVLQRPRIKGPGKETYSVRINPLKKWLL